MDFQIASKGDIVADNDDNDDVNLSSLSVVMVEVVVDLEAEMITPFIFVGVLLEGCILVTVDIGLWNDVALSSKNVTPTTTEMLNHLR
jgi:hypothetical protein